MGKDRSGKGWGRSGPTNARGAQRGSAGVGGGDPAKGRPLEGSKAGPVADEHRIDRKNRERRKSGERGAGVHTARPRDADAAPGHDQDAGGRAGAIARLGRAGTTLQWFAVAAPGLEEAVRREVAILPGVHEVALVDGGVSFAGPAEVGMRANLSLRIATRILLRLGEVRAREFAELKRRMRALPWEALIPPGPLRVEAAASRCRLYHTGALAEAAADAVSERVPGVLAPAPSAQEDEGDGARVLLRGRDDRFTVSVDTSGALLHRRGWRVETGRAPLRETLAAGLLALCGYDPARPFLDPMCGSGTIALEACAQALGVAPGLARSFSFERWPSFDATTWASVRDEALAAIRTNLSAPVFAFDRDAEAVEIARRNAERAGFLRHMCIERRTFGEGRAPEGAGLLVMNPPYGRRIGADGPKLVRDIGRTLRATYGGWRAGIIVPVGARGAFGLRTEAEHALSNGGLRIQLLVAAIAESRAPWPSSDERPS